MLGSKDRQRIPKPYFDARALQKSFPKWARVFFWFTVALPFGVMIFLMPGAGYSFLPLIVFFAAWLFGRKLLCRRPLGVHRGEVCPCCWRKSDNPKPGCRGCQPPAGRVAHRTYWRMMRVSFPFAEQAFSDRFLGEHEKAPMTRAMKGFLALVIAVPAIGVLWVVFETVYLNDLGWMDSGYSPWVWMIAIPAGVLLAYYGKRRAGASQHCAGCDYQLAPVGDRPQACPECGKNLDGPDGVVLGRQVGSRWPAVIVWSVFSLFILLPLSNMFDGFALSPTRLVPTSKFISHVITTDDIDYTVRRELESRRLDDGHLTDLIDEIERRLNGADPSLTLDEHYWDGYVSDLIVAESSRRTLPHAIKLRLLEMDRTWDRAFPYDLRELVENEIAAGSYSSAELQAAEMLTPIKRTPTEDFLNRLVDSVELDWQAEEELKTRRLNDAQLGILIDELERRLVAKKHFGPGKDPTYWGMTMGEIIVGEMNQRRQPGEIAMRLVELNNRFGDRLPYDLKRWAKQMEAVNANPAFETP